jgi:hypothetical protein
MIRGAQITAGSYCWRNGGLRHSIFALDIRLRSLVNNSCWSQHFRHGWFPITARSSCFVKNSHFGMSFYNDI